jgi:hypothetical protein
MAEKEENSEIIEGRNGSEKQTGISPSTEFEVKDGLRTVDEGFLPIKSCSRLMRQRGDAS